VTQTVGAHADARAVLSAWIAPSPEQDDLRRLYLDHLDAHPDALLRGCEPDHLTASSLIVRGDEVLLVFHTKAGKWLQTGGHCEPTDATLSAAAWREAHEESGIVDLTVDPVPLQLSRHHVPFCGGRAGSGGGHHLDVQFLVTAEPDAQISIAADEDDARWFPLDPAAAPEPTDQDVRNLIAAARSRLRGTP
jgi:ADP-ribose pyrophosphatase YjhB (NUDIX family)